MTARITKPTSAAAWKKKAQIPPLELPSGCSMRIKKVGMQTLISLGIMPNSLMSIAQKAVGKGQQVGEGMSDDEMMALINDPKKIREIGEFMDKMLCVVAVEPEVHPIPHAGVERDETKLYVDEVDEEDKMFIFQVVTGGTTDVAEFREETSATMAAIRGREDVELPSE